MAKNTITLTESKLREKITEIISEILKEQRPIDNFRFVLRRRFGDIIGNVLDGRIDEGLIKSYPADQVERMVRTHLGFDNPMRKQYLFREIGDNGGDVFMFLLPAKAQFCGMMETEIERTMNACGYYLADSFSKSLTPNELKGKKRTRREVPTEFDILKYEKKYDDIVDVKQWKYIYHTTSMRHLDKIKQIGLAPRSANSVFNYPERIYFMNGDVSRQEAESLASKLRYAEESSPQFNSRIKICNDYVLLRVDTSKLDDSMIFYNGQDLPHEIFTHDNVPPSAIEVCDFSVLS